MQRQLNVPRTLRKVASACPDPDLRRRLRQAADAILEPQGVLPGVHTETPDPMEAVTVAEEVLLPLFEGKNSKDELVRAASDMTLTLAAWTRQLDTLIDAMDPETPELADIRASVENVRANVETLVPWAQKWKDIANAEPETNTPKFPEMPKTKLPTPTPETEDTDEEPEGAAETPPEEAADSSILDMLAEEVE